MKTIKELDKMQPNPPWLGYREALKHVLGLIDEMRKGMRLIDSEELKARIIGEISEKTAKEKEIKIDKNKKGWGRSYGYPKPSPVVEDAK